MIYLDLILEVVKYTLAGYALLGYKPGKKCYRGIVVMLCSFILLGSITDSIGSLQIINVPIIGVGLFLMADGTFQKRLSYSVMLIFFVLCIDYVVQTFVKMMTPQDIDDVIKWLISNAGSIALYGLISLLRKCTNIRKNTKLQAIGQVVLYVGSVIMAVTMPLIISQLNLGVENRTASTKGIQLLSALAMLSMAALVMLVIYINHTNAKMKHYLDVEKALKETQKNYYEAVIQKEEDTKKFRHDVSNHMMCLQELAERGEMKAVKQYIAEMQGEMKRIQKCCYSVGNIVLDAVLNQYLSMLPEKTDCRVQGILSDNLPIGQVELCTIFSNLMRNSIEELEKLQAEKRYIGVKVHMGDEDFSIEVCNSARQRKLVGADGLPRTTKKNLKNHGYGLKNIKEAVERNQGIFLWQSTEEKFSVKVILPLRSRG